VDWKGGVVEGLTFRSGLYNDEPLRKTIAKYWTGVKRNITVGTTNIANGEFVNFNETIGDLIQQASICSSSIPGFFPMQNWMGGNFVDGGVIYGNDIGEAIERCFIVTGDYSKITIDMLSCDNGDLNKTTADLKTLEVRTRVEEIRKFDNMMSNVYTQITAFPTVNWRYFINPSVSLGAIPLNFTHEALMYNYQVGLKDGANIINKNILTRDIIDEWMATNGAIKGETIIIE